MRAHVPRGAVTAMEAPGFESPPATGKLAGHFGASTPSHEVEWRPPARHTVSAPGGVGGSCTQKEPVSAGAASASH